MSQKNPPEVFTFFSTQLGIFNPNFTYLFFLSTLDYKFLFNYLVMTLSATTRNAYRPMVDMFSI